VRGEIWADKVRENIKFARRVWVRKDLFDVDPRLETRIDPFNGSIHAIMFATIICGI
jgi:hypothetical protein